MKPPPAFTTLLTTLKADTSPSAATTPGIEVALGETPDAPVHLRSTATPDIVVTTDHDK
ncbi:hypothetical protein [Streptomyces sp. NPDC002156]